MSRLRVLIVDPNELFRDSLAALFERNGFEAVVASTAGEGLGHLREAGVALVVLEIDLPLPQGLVFLQQVRQLAGGGALPVMVLTSVVDKGVILRVKNLGVREYLLKQVLTTERLLERVRLAIDPSGAGASVESPAETKVEVRPAVVKRSAVVKRAGGNVAGSAAKAGRKISRTDTAQWPKLLTREQTLALVDGIADGKTIAGVVSQVIALANSPRADLTDLVRIIESDPILATRVLQLSNSPAFASARGRVSTVEGAARNIGLRGIQNMALSIGIFNAFPPDETDGFNTMRCWQHSFAVADIMVMLGEGGAPGEEATNHLVGLCHDLEAILLRQHFAPHYEQIVEFATAHGLPLHAVEACAMGIRRPELVVRLLTHIGLPAQVGQAIKEFCERETRGAGVTVSPMARHLGIANQLAHGLLLAASTSVTVAPITRTEWRQVGGDRPVPAFDAVIKRNEIIASTNILARLPAKDEQRMVMPLAPKSGVRLWYVRPENFVELDPLAMALSFTSNVHVASALPQGEEWAELDGMVVAGHRAGAVPLVPGDIVAACAAAGRAELPVLGLMVQGEQPEDVGHLSFGKMPVSLDALHRWMIGIEGDSGMVEGSREVKCAVA